MHAALSLRNVRLAALKRILLTTASSTATRGVILGLRAAPEPFHLIGVEASQYHILQAQPEVDELHIVPRADDPRYIEVLADIAAETSADFIWPLHDAEIEQVSRSTNLPCRSWVPPLEVCLICRDKLATYNRLKGAGVPVPRSMMLNYPADIEQAFADLGDAIWIRSRQGAGSRGAYRADTIDLASSWLNIHDGWGRFMAAEVMPGPSELSWECIWSEGQLIAAQVETRLVRGNTGISLPGVTNRGVLLKDGPDSVGRVAEQAIRAIMPEPDGMFRVDLISDSEGMPKVTEVDAGRFGAGGVAYWHEYGYNWAYEALRIGMGESVDYPVPVLNPCPPDMASITGFNRMISFIHMQDVEALVVEYHERLNNNTKAAS